MSSFGSSIEFVGSDMMYHIYFIQIRLFTRFLRLTTNELMIDPFPFIKILAYRPGLSAVEILEM